MTSDELAVSIITPSLNQALYLEDALRSVAIQTYPLVEHVVMDGGSTDGSVEVLKDWAKSHDITWESRPDGGQAAAIQRGVELAHGGIVAWLNSDDMYLDAQVIADVVAMFERGADAVTGGGWYIGPAGERRERIQIRADQVTHRALRFRDWILQPATFIRRDLFLAHPLDTSLAYAFDWDQLIRLSAEARFTLIDRELAGYRLHSTGKSITGGRARQRELMEVTRRNHRRMTLHYGLTWCWTTVNSAASGLPAPIALMVHGGSKRLSALVSRVAPGRGIPV